MYVEYQIYLVLHLSNINQLIRHKDEFIHSHNIVLPWFTPSQATSTNIFLSSFIIGYKYIMLCMVTILILPLSHRLLDPCEAN